MKNRLKFYWKYPSFLFSNIYFRIKSLFICDHYDIIILDDIFPHKISAWRYEEFISYLQLFKKKICIYTTGNSIGALHDTKGIRKHIKEFKSKNPLHRKNIKLFQHYRKVNAKLAYVIFLHNAYSNLEFFERNKIPFIFTLYPGAGFLLKQESTDYMLGKVMSSKFFKGVITTQKVTTDYIKQKKYCSPSKIHFIYGVVTPRIFLSNTNNSMKDFLQNGVLNVAFVANKQMAQGIDKGYDIFIETAKIFLKKNSQVIFHVIGPFNEDDIDITSIKGNIKFHGYKSTDEFPSFYSNIDIIISPNRPFILKPGAFDGFPTSACTEAALNAVAMMVTDPLNLNLYFKDGNDIIIIQNNAQEISEKLFYYQKNPEILKNIALNGQKKCKHIYSVENQLSKRLEILRKQLEL